MPGCREALGRLEALSPAGQPEGHLAGDPPDELTAHPPGLPGPRSAVVDRPRIGENRDSEDSEDSGESTESRESTERGESRQSRQSGLGKAASSTEVVPGQDSGTAWMVAFSRGDEACFELIVKTYFCRILRFLQRRVRDPGRAEDLAQEVFLRVYRSRRSYQPTARFRSWLFTIAHHLVLNELRAIRRRHRVFARVLPSAGAGGGADIEEASLQDFWASVPDPGQTGAERSLELKELEGMVRANLERLPLNQRTAMELASGEGLSYAEIAGVLGVTVGAVRSLLVRARRALRAGLEAYLDRGQGWGEAKA